MKKLTAILASLFISAAANAHDVYLCKKDGKTVYTESPTNNGDCRLLEMKIIEPSAEELDRQQQQRQRDEAQRQIEEEQSREERIVRAQEAAARAEQRRARAAEEQALYQRQLLQAHEEEERRRADSVPSYIFVPSLYQQRRIQTEQPGMLDIHIGPRPQRPVPNVPTTPPSANGPWLLRPGESTTTPP